MSKNDELVPDVFEKLDTNKTITVNFISFNG